MEENGRTTLTLRVQYESREARDAVLKSPMKSGVEAGFNKLEELLVRSAEAMGTRRP